MIVVQNTDNAFINFSYLSEKYLAVQLEQFSSSLSSYEKEILNDEKRHAALLLNALKKFEQESNIEHSLKCSIYEAVYVRLGGFDFNKINSFGDFKCVQAIIERRARILYLRFMRRTTNELYKKILSQIIEDEKKHEAHNFSEPQSSIFFEFDEIDRQVWRVLLKEHTTDGSSGQFGLQFWQTIFDNAKETKDSWSTPQIPMTS